MTLQDDEGPIDAEIAACVASVVPSSWRGAALEVEVTSDGSLVHTIRSIEGFREPVSPPEELYEETFRLFDLFVRAGRPWKRVRYLLQGTQDGEWDYEVSFEYP